MWLTFRVLVLGGMLSTLPILWRIGPKLKSTNLTTAWRWSLGVACYWCLVEGMTLVPGMIAEPLVDQLWYALSVVLLCPPIAVLGARRPGSRVWNWFVLAPLVVVLGRPIITSWNRDFEAVALHVETPFLLGHLLVLVMGTGNFLGTRHTLAALLFGSALLTLLSSFYESGLAFLTGHRDVVRICGSLLLSASIWTAFLKSRGEPQTFGFNLIWRDFRDHFGIVWARPIQERINETARKENWCARLEFDGFRWTEADVDAQEIERTNQRIEHTLRWLLRRFIDPEWIDERLGKSPTVPERNDSVG